MRNLKKAVVLPFPAVPESVMTISLFVISDKGVANVIGPSSSKLVLSSTYSISLSDSSKDSLFLVVARPHLR